MELVLILPCARLVEGPESWLLLYPGPEQSEKYVPWQLEGSNWADDQAEAGFASDEVVAIDLVGPIKEGC
jgi:hypothetical protein